MPPEQDQNQDQDLENKNSTVTGGAKDDSDDVSNINDTTGGGDELIEIQISDDTVAGDQKAADKAADKADADGADRKAPKKNSKDRIRELNKQLRAEQNRNAELEQIVGTQGKQITAVHRQNIEQFELRAQGAVDQALKDLKAAKEAGDIDAEVAASDKLSEAKAYVVRIREAKSEMGITKDNKGEVHEGYREPRRPARAEQDGDEVDVANPVRDKWVSSNGWFDNDSEDYDDEMAADARSYATGLEAKMRRENTPELIGTRAYFRRIDEYMKENYPDRFDGDSPNRTPPMKGERNGVTAPVRNGSLGGKKSGGGGNKIVLTRAEYDVAMSLGNSSAGQNADGTRKSERELAQMYIKQRDSSGEQSRRDFEREGFKQRGIQV